MCPDPQRRCDKHLGTGQSSCEEHGNFPGSGIQLLVAPTSYHDDQKHFHMFAIGLEGRLYFSWLLPGSGILNTNDSGAGG
jgi:hypothetical protein